jgi:3-deoxy-manno-octulosonate cytidylyltransferase (CMP-KDO synthetase)
MDNAHQALYFSRSPIPYGRDIDGHFPAGHAFKHIGIYSYRVDALLAFARLPPSVLEQIECLEQLRALQAGLRIGVGFTDNPPPRGVDTAEDLAYLRGLSA